MRRMIRGAVVAAALAAALTQGAGSARAAGTFEGHVDVLGPWGSAAMTAFQTSRCQPNAFLQGVDGLVVPAGQASTFTITATAPVGTVGYGVHLFDAGCGYLGARSNVEGNTGTDALVTADPAKAPGTISFTTEWPVTWLVITGGWGADVDFTITWS